MSGVIHIILGFRQPVSVSVTPRHSVDSHHRQQHLLTASHCIPLSGLPETCHKLSTTPLIPHRCYRHFSVGQCHHQPQYHLRSTILVEVYSSWWSFLPTIVVVAIVGAPPVAIAPLEHINPICAWLCPLVRQAAIYPCPDHVLLCCRVNLQSSIGLDQKKFKFLF